MARAVCMVHVTGRVHSACHVPRTVRLASTRVPHAATGAHVELARLQRAVACSKTRHPASEGKYSQAASAAKSANQGAL